MDALRGACFVFMTVDHFRDHPVARFSNPTYGPFGFFTAALGFVFLSGLVSGWAYEGRRMRFGGRAMTCSALRRVRAVYLTQLVLCIALAAVVALHVRGVERWHLAVDESSPWRGLVYSASLLYEPTYLGILPMYCLFLLVTPIVVSQLAKGNLRYVLGASVLIWIVGGIAFRLPSDPNGIDLGGFNPLSYQLLFVVGLAFGTGSLSAVRLVGDRLTCLLAAAAIFAGACEVARYDYAFHGPFSTLVDRSAYLTSAIELGPLRLLDFAAFALLLYAFATRIRWADVRPPAFRWLAFVGRNSLPVFAWSIAVTYAATALLPSGLAWPEATAAAVLVIASLTIPAGVRSALRAHPLHPLLRQTDPVRVRTRTFLPASLPGSELRLPRSLRRVPTHRVATLHSGRPSSDGVAEPT